jgi:acid phosphatase family membrane protein YuiD
MFQKMNLSFSDVVLFNPILFAALSAWAIAQLSKVFIEFFSLRRWNWALVFEAGGMPSSHSAMVSATALSVGLQIGFDTAIFAISAMLAMIVIYDATGVRRESGRQAVLINSIIDEITKGNIPPQEKLKEVLGHTPGEAFLGMTLGLLIAVVLWLIIS